MISVASQGLRQFDRAPAGIPQRCWGWSSGRFPARIVAGHYQPEAAQLIPGIH